MSLIDNGLALIEGVALIASPCILPVLPLILSTSLDGGRGRPLGIIVGFITSFSLFAFFSRFIVLSTGVNLDYIKYGSLALLGLFGCLMLSKSLSEKFGVLTQSVATVGVRYSGKNNGGFGAGLGIGALIGLIWTPCAGPILAAILVQIIRQKSNMEGFITLIFFAIGAGLPMLIIAVMGRSIMNQLAFFKQHTDAIRKSLGSIIILSVIFIASGFDPQRLLPQRGDGMATKETNSSMGLTDALVEPYAAPDFLRVDTWLNSSPLSMQALKGKVVLVDFWTYSCINCIRTLPFMVSLYEKYRDKGFVLVGVHAPEFEFEKNVNNIKAAIEQYHITYPVAVDSSLSTWDNYQNHYWPAQYLIDKEGKVVYTHFGEGDDEILEHNVKTLLGVVDTSALPEAEQSTYHPSQTPETYLGLSRAERFMGVHTGPERYAFPEDLPSNTWALEGQWKVHAQKIISGEKGGALRIHFNAKKVFLVMGTETGTPIQVTVLLNGKPAPQSNLTVDRHTLYTLFEQQAYGEGILEIRTSSPGLELYAFTFGG